MRTDENSVYPKRKRVSEIVKMWVNVSFHLKRWLILLDRKDDGGQNVGSPLVQVADPLEFATGGFN